jgi:D-amino peptidase
MALFTMKLFISIDIEGVAGVVSREQLSPAGFEYETARELMTNELLAAIDGASQAGIQEFIVADSHGNGQNVLIDKLPENVQLVRSWPRPLMMMQGVEEDDMVGAFLLGYHPGENCAIGNMAHTCSGKLLMGLKINGIEMNETGISAAIAGHFDVPVLMATGEDYYVNETRGLLGEIETVVTKYSYGVLSSRNIAPAASCAAIAKAAKNAIERREEFQPYHLQAPFIVDVVFKSRVAAELFDYLPITEKMGAHEIRFHAENMIDVSKMIAFFVHAHVEA